MTSPKKSRPQTAAAASQDRTMTVTERFTVTHLDQRGHDELQLAYKAANVELEHKMQTLYALGQKLNVFNDLKNDVSESQNAFKTSEVAREKLQVTITTTAEKLKEDTEMKEKFQETLQQQIAEHAEKIQEQEREAARVKQVHLKQLDEQDHKHNTTVTGKNTEIAALREDKVKMSEAHQRDRKEQDDKHHKEREEKHAEMVK
jgi:hypothetical protein